jgi:hypothetical protein
MHPTILLILFSQGLISNFVTSNKPTLTMCFGYQSTLKFFVTRSKMSCALSDVHKSKLEIIVLLHSTNIGRTYFYYILSPKSGNAF